jgi:ABC-type lipoprotein export system ATPase subunit
LKLAKFVSPTPKTTQKQKRRKDTTTAHQRELGRVYKMTRSFQCKRQVGMDKRSQDAFTEVSGGQGQAVHLWCARKIQEKNSDKNN